VRVRLRGEIKDLQRRLGVTTIMVTHDQEEALTMADRIVVMNHGRIEQVGTPTTIYKAPQTAFVADFIGAMNLMPGIVEADGTLRIGPHRLTPARTDGFQPGRPVRLGIRPEEVRLTATPGENRLPATVAASIFMGAFTRLTLQVDGFDRPLEADVATTDLGLGSTTFVDLPSAALRVFPA
jgi:iron(III) transport system ATP-binding protein